MTQHRPKGLYRSTGAELAAELRALVPLMGAINRASVGHTREEQMKAAMMVAAHRASEADIPDDHFALFARQLFLLCDGARRKRLADAVARIAALDPDFDPAAALRAAIDGSPEPPTDAEIAAHWRTGGRWRCVPRRSLDLCADALRGDGEVQRHRALLAARGITATWWAIDADFRVCARPKVDAAPAPAGEGPDAG